MINFHLETLEKHPATLITFNIENNVTTPEEAFNVELPEVPFDKGIILSGRGPIWLFARLIHHYHPTKWVAVHDPRIGYIVVQSHCPEKKEGQVIL
jgi:CRISPR-associated protein Csx3